MSVNIRVALLLISSVFVFCFVFARDACTRSCVLCVRCVLVMWHVNLSVFCFGNFL